MKLSTRISHARIRLKHDFLKLRVQRPVYYKVLATLVLIFAIGGLLAAYLFYLNGNRQVALGDKTQLEIKTYSLNGEVVRASGNNITVKVGILKSQNGINQVVYENKTVLINENTKITTIKLQNNRAMTTAGEPQNITPGKLVAIYTSSNPNTLSELLADKIEIIEQ